LEKARRIEGLIDFIAAHYRNVAEVGIGNFPDVAYALLEKGLKVFATDIRTVHHRGVSVIGDDVTNPDASLYRGVDLLYSMRPPPELVPYMKKLADLISADLIIKPLSSEYIEGWKLMLNGNTTFFIPASAMRRMGGSEGFSFNDIQKRDFR
jgi:uncharacterized UPF0146 family protein